jgi:hypothetical protein
LLNAPKTVHAINRTTPLTAPISYSKKIGVLGGTIVVPGTGLTIVVPPLAVASNTTFTVTALAGSAVAYDFGPHGRFLLPLVMTQALRDIDARKGGLLDPLSLQLGYFPDANDITSVTELLTVTVSLPTETAVATVRHFSGYRRRVRRADDGSFLPSGFTRDEALKMMANDSGKLFDPELFARFDRVIRSNTLYQVHSAATAPSNTRFALAG